MTSLFNTDKEDKKTFVAPEKDHKLCPTRHAFSGGEKEPPLSACIV